MSSQTVAYTRNSHEYAFQSFLPLCFHCLQYTNMAEKPTLQLVHARLRAELQEEVSREDILNDIQWCQ